MTVKDVIETAKKGHWIRLYSETGQILAQQNGREEIPDTYADWHVLVLDCYMGGNIALTVKETYE